MEEYIQKLFAASGFVLEGAQGATLFFTRANADRSEYYLVLFIKKVDLSDMTSKFDEVSIMFESRKKTARDIEKNTSLVICVEFDSYAADCVRYKNRLLQIEEDEYSYRKYVIPYTQAALSGLGPQDDIVNSINNIVTDEHSFEAFTNHTLGNESYFFAMQLFIKLPFLNLSINRGQNFVTIAALLSEKISPPERQLMSDLLQERPLEQNARDQLMQKVLDPNDHFFDKFFNSVPGDAPTT